jgi:acetoacetate decarboxylase
MGLKGKLTREQFGFSTPVDAPLYPAPPYYYYGSTLLLFQYLTDPESAASILPAQLELTDPPVAGFFFANHPTTFFGAYHEVGQFIQCTSASLPGPKPGAPPTTIFYIPYIFTDNDAINAMGREMAGYPKKMGKIDISTDVYYRATLERPAGNRLCSGMLKPVAQAPAEQVPSPFPMIFGTLRLIPTLQAGARPTVAELLITEFQINNPKVWIAQGSCEIFGRSDLDPLYKLPVRGLLPPPFGCQILFGDPVFPAPAKVITEPFQ